MKIVTTDMLIYDAKNDRYLIPRGLSNRYFTTYLCDETFSHFAKSIGLSCVRRLPISSNRTILFLDRDIDFAQTCFSYYEIYGGFPK